LLKDKSGSDNPIDKITKAYTPDLRLKMQPIVSVISMIKKVMKPIAANDRTNAAQPPIYFRGGIKAERSFHGMEIREMNLF